jgi:hypothetical protein
MSLHVKCVYLVVFFCSSQVFAATYYASPTGSGSTCSIAAPCNVAAGIGKLVAGDTLYLTDGTYTGAAGMIRTNGLNGTSGSRITIAALNEGEVWINGGGTYRPVEIYNSTYITVQGVNAYNSGTTTVVSLLHPSAGAPHAGYNHLKRVIAWDAMASDPAAGTVIIAVQYESNDVVEDCAGFGRGRMVFYNFNGNNTVFRRNWGRFMGYAQNSNSPKISAMLDYTGNSNIVWENNIGEYDYAAGNMNNMYGIFALEPAATVGLYGNIALYRHGDNFGYACCLFMLQPGTTETGPGGKVTARNNVALIQPSSRSQWPFYGHSLVNGHISDHNTSIKGVGGKSSYWDSNWTVTNFLEQETIGSYNLYTNIGPGATIRYRYQNGTLTNTPLWPWPMAARIKAALNFSGYDSNYDVDASIQSVFGSYPAAGTPPQSPLNLHIVSP